MSVECETALESRLGAPARLRVGNPERRAAGRAGLLVRRAAGRGTALRRHGRAPDRIRDRIVGIGASRRGEPRDYGEEVQAGRHTSLRPVRPIAAQGAPPSPPGSICRSMGP